MKRDMDLIRRIALATQALPHGEALEGLDGVPTDQFCHHVAWMVEAGLAHGDFALGSGSMALHAWVERLTWQGCEFADAAASDTLWAKAHEQVIRPGLSFSFELLKDWLKAEIQQGLPTLRRIGQ